MHPICILSIFLAPPAGKCSVHNTNVRRDSDRVKPAHRSPEERCASIPRPIHPREGAHPAHKAAHLPTGTACVRACAAGHRICEHELPCRRRANGANKGAHTPGGHAHTRGARPSRAGWLGALAFLARNPALARAGVAVGEAVAHALVPARTSMCAGAAPPRGRVPFLSMRLLVGRLEPYAPFLS